MVLRGGEGGHEWSWSKWGRMSGPKRDEGVLCVVLGERRGSYRSQGYLAHKKPPRPPLGPYSRPVPRALWWLVLGEGALFCEPNTPAHEYLGCKHPALKPAPFWGVARC